MSRLIQCRFFRAPPVVAHADGFMHPLQQARAAYLESDGSPDPLDPMDIHLSNAAYLP